MVVSPFHASTAIATAFIPDSQNILNLYVDLTDPQKKIRDLLAAREQFYKQADVLVNTDIRSPREVAQHVVHQFRLEASGR